MIKPLIVSVVVFGFAGPALAQIAPGRDAAEKLDAQHEQAEQRASDLLKSSARVRVEMADLQQQLIALGAKRDAHRSALNATAERLETLAFQEKVILTKLDNERAGLMDLLAALQRAEMSHPPALAVSPDDINEAARASLLLTSAAPELKKRADKLSATLGKLSTVRAGIADEQAQLSLQEKTLKTSTQALQNLLEQRQKLERSLRKGAVDAARQAQVFASRASTLRELINQLEDAASRSAPRRKPARQAPGEATPRTGPRHKPDPNAVLPNEPFIAPTARFADSRGHLRLPVNGTIAYAFGKANDKPRRSGIIIQAKRGSQVTVPFDGRILYSGLFRNLGRLLILSVGNGYHIIIAGLERSYVVSDQLVLAGEPVGELANRSKPAPELYLEIQKDGRSIDPVPWLEKKAGKGHSVP